MGTVRWNSGLGGSGAAPYLRRRRSPAGSAGISLLCSNRGQICWRSMQAKMTTCSSIEHFVPRLAPPFRGGFRARFRQVAPGTLRSLISGSPPAKRVMDASLQWYHASVSLPFPRTSAVRPLASPSRGAATADRRRPPSAAAGPRPRALAAAVVKALEVQRHAAGRPRDVNALEAARRRDVQAVRRRGLPHVGAVQLLLLVHEGVQRRISVAGQAQYRNGSFTQLISPVAPTPQPTPAPLRRHARGRGHCSTSARVPRVRPAAAPRATAAAARPHARRRRRGAGHAPAAAAAGRRSGSTCCPGWAWAPGIDPFYSLLLPRDTKIVHTINPAA